MQPTVLLTGVPLVLACAVCLVLLMGVRAKRRLKIQHPPPGEMIDIGGYRLHIDSRGDGAPAVVMDAGISESGQSWALIQPEIAKFTRVIVYDRAGLGWSDPSPLPRTNTQMVEELHTLLHTAHIAQPFVLVGASLGGLNARLYAHRYPSEVVGLVLVDAAHEEQYSSDGMREAFDRILKMMPLMYGGLRLIIRMGLPALFPRRFTKILPSDPRLPQDTADTVYALRVSDTKSLSASAAELAAVPASHAEIRAAGISSLGDIPLIVIQHGQVEQMATPELTEMNEQTNRKLQALVATQSSNGRLIIAEESGHAIQYQRPDLVIRSIRELVEGARLREIRTTSRLKEWLPAGQDIPADCWSLPNRVDSLSGNEPTETTI